MRRFAAIVFLCPVLVWAATLEGRVVLVADGNTISVMDVRKQQHRVRLAGIDAPELGQAFATRSRENLAKWVFRRDVVVEWNKKDRHGRIVGVVLVDGHDVNLEQVRAGMAWCYSERPDGQTAEVREVYELAEKAARERKLGLWVDPAPIPPWEWRRVREPGPPRSN